MLYCSPTTEDMCVSPLYCHIFATPVAPSLAFCGLLWKSLRFIQFELQVGILDANQSLPNTVALGFLRSPCILNYVYHHNTIHPHSSTTVCHSYTHAGQMDLACPVWPSIVAVAHRHGSQRIGIPCTHGGAWCPYPLRTLPGEESITSLGTRGGPESSECLC